MKRICSVLLSILLVLAIVPHGAMPASAATGDWLTVPGIEGGQIRFDSSTGTITDCETSVTAANIPSTVNGIKVTGIGYSAFEVCSSLVSVTIPDTVTSIGPRAFEDCSSLTSVTIPNSVTEISGEAFCACSSLTSITIPGSVTSMGSRVFLGCTALASVDILSGVTNIGGEMFRDCNSLTSVTIPDSVTNIGYFAFNSNSLVDISVASGNANFASKNGVLFDKDFKKIIRCPEAKSGNYSIPASVTEIEFGAFEECTRLDGVSIPDGVTNIGYYAFEKCNNLTRLTIPNSVTNIGERAFAFCSSLTSVTIPASVTSIGENAFWYCEKLTSITIPNSVTSIADGTFDSCSGLTDVNISNGVISIGSRAFSSCSSLTRVIIPNTVTSIGDEAFWSCDKITSIIIPDSVTSIGSEAFWSCDSLTNVTIGKSVTSIGDEAFWGCDKIANIIIPDSVISLGNGSFSGCRNLTSVTIGKNLSSIGNDAFSDCRNLASFFVASGNANYVSKDGVLFSKGFKELIRYPEAKKGSYVVPGNVINIGKNAFYACENLTSVEIPNSVISIGTSAFQACSSLTSINMENNVTSIGDSAFYLCRNLTNVTLSNKITRIGNDVFSICQSLTCVDIPKSVTSIGERAFDWCHSLTSVTIPNSVASIEDSAFYDCNRLKDVYYEGIENQWGKIEIGSDNEKLKNATIHYNSTADDMYSDIRKKAVTKGAYVFRVVNSDGKSINGATVSANGTSHTTDHRGEAILPSFSIGNPVITISKSGYQSWTNANSNWTGNSDRYETVVLYTEAEGRYKLKSAVYSNSKDFRDNNTNLLISTKKIALKSDKVFDWDFGDFYLSVKSYAPDQTEKYQFLQDNTVKSESADGKFALNVKDFSKGGNCSIRVIAKDGTKVDTHINLEFAENKVNKSTSLKLGKGCTFSVGDEVPFLGSSKISIDFDELPVDFEWTGEKLHIGFNLKAFDSSDKPDKEKEARWESIKKSFANVKRLKNAYSTFSPSTFQKIIKEDKDFSLPGTGKVKVNVCGYAEADWGSSTAKGELYVIVNANTKTFGFNTMVVMVPVTVQIKATASLQAGAEIAYNWETNTLTGGLDLNVSVGLNAFGGVGVGKVVGVGVYGDAKVKMDSRLFGTNPGVEKVDLTGELGLKAYLACLTYERAFAHHTWNLYTANKVNKAPQRLNAGPGNAGDLYNAASYVPEDFSYLEKESSWLGGTVRRRAPSRNGAAAKVELTSLLTSTYRNAQPSMTSAGDKLYGAFLRMDENQRVYTAVTVFNGMTWSAPVRADSAAQLDDAPQLYADKSGKVFLTYAQTTAGTDGTDLLEYAKNQSIVVGTVAVDGSFTRTNTFAPVAGSRAYLQTLGTVNGKPALAWAEAAITSESDIFTPARTLVKLSTFDGTAWSAARTLTTLNHPLRQMVIGDTGVAVLIDTDDDLHTSEDVKLTLISLTGEETELASGISGKVSYAKLPGETAAAFVWNAEESLVTSTGKTISAPGITSEYQITEDGIYYSRAEENSADLVKLPYVQGAWGEAIKLTNGGRYLENLEIASLAGNDYVFGMHTAVTIGETSVTPDKNLVWARVVPVSDLRIDSVEYDRDIVTPGENMPVKVSVTNVGDHAVSSVMLAKDGETPVDGGALAVGESKEITVNIPCPETLTEYTFTVTEGEQTTAADYTPDDNTAKTSIGYGNLAVTLSYEQIGEAKDLVAVVKNTGVSKASGKVTFYDDAGTAYAETKLGDMEAGDVVVVRFPVPEEFSSRFGGDVTAKVTADSEELYDYDNIATLNISEVLNAEITELTASDAGIVARIHYEGKENLATAYCAFYNENGKMLRVRSVSLTTSTGEYRFDSVPGAVRAKVFALKSEVTPLCESKAVGINQ